jgi:hypothetical protein
MATPEAGLPGSIGAPALRLLREALHERGMSLG